MPEQFYESVERDNRIRDIMISKRFESLRAVNKTVPDSKRVLQQVHRKKFWGELKDSDS